jgi:serine/threonine protein kinase
MKEIEINKRCQRLLKKLGYDEIENLSLNWKVPYVSSCPVFVGKKDGEKIVAKFARTGEDWSNKHLSREKEVLRKFSGYPGIPKLYELVHLAKYGVYYNRAVSSLLFREFLEGKLISQEGEITEHNHAKIMSQVIIDLHEVGYAGLDIKPGNLIIGNYPGIIDFGSLKRRDEVTPEEFARLAISDACSMERFIGYTGAK